MPIFISDYIWKQTDSTLLITIPINNIQSSKLHFFSTDDFIKINYASFILELFLYKPVIKSKTKCIVRQNEVLLELQKAEPGVWDSLQQEVHRKEIVQRVEQVLSENRENEQKQIKAKKEEKEEAKRYLRGEAMSIHMQEQEEIRKAKNTIVKTAEKDFIKWENCLKSDSKKSLQKHNTKIITASSVPFPRKCATISFSFTPRVFPTPKRESKSEEEKEWLKKEAEARRCTGFVVEDLTEEERNPSWLLSKGESFMKHENYAAAVNAFAYGMELRPKMPAFYVRLAEAHLKLNNFHKAAESVSQALDLLQPCVEENRLMRADAYRIRSAAFKNMGEEKLSCSDSQSSNTLMK